MKIIYNKIFLEHDTESHPENRKRLEAFKNLRQTKVESAEKYLKLVHKKEYIEKVKKMSGKERFLDIDTVLSEKSFKVACYAAGAAILASKSGGFALVRPPGHHAGIEKGQGFCLFNNIAVAVQKLAKKNKRIFILDFDGHFGNGTAEIFYDTDKVLYTSLHQEDEYPYGLGKIEDIGRGKGRGYKINIPLLAESGDDLFLSSVEYFISIAKQFKPDVVGVSAGFDSCHSDPLLRLNFSVNSYYQVGKLLSQNFSNIFAVLEGGYNLDYLPKCVYNFIAGVNKEKIRFKEKTTESSLLTKKNYDNTLKNLSKILSPFWKV
ncbi:MAG: acetylpolyamine amidohydrolase [Candidatus Nealsonbacteria bacterium CG_4_10_14_0_2_um_filter_38_17]|uniref:Acetylpolyamine amidohydrolase n=2 Tax=Candidatus Nealsoniibacteriota TaxID=1817911 RepID=A0A2M7UX38_9BACT|nr:MAG: acetylpolyamine amidohydrolase [Candidatus Nealsonbacteria bacterium CG23_combo_of_CG06-09_8_20_14_all_38_19]PIZ88517.1 MAG: acetylpolyamine amidohydrolase [Candidatus Nealsonbacteria bacterium CG_4_10_14_0_2_um_filter_38_17]